MRLQPMKILIVLDRYYPTGGGIQQYVRGLAHQLRQDGHAITILTESGPDLPDREEWDEGTIIRTPLLGGALPQPEIMLERWPQLVPFIEDAQPDIVLANNHTSIGTIPAAHAAGVPVVYSCHGWGLFCTLKIRLLRPDDTLCYNERRLETCLACQDMLAPPQPPRVAGKGRGLLAAHRLAAADVAAAGARRCRPLVARYESFSGHSGERDARIGDFQDDRPACSGRRALSPCTMASIPTITPGR